MHRLSALWRLAVSPVTFVTLSLLWCLDLAVGSFLNYYNPDIFGSMDAYPFALWLDLVGSRAMPLSLWVYLLAVLTWAMIVSLLFCTLNWFFRRRKRMRGVGEVLVHLGFLLVFAGFVLGSTMGTRVQGLAVAEGESAAVGETGLALRLDRIEAVTGPGGRPVDTPASVALLRDGREVASGVSRTNHPLLWGATVVYSRSLRQQLSGVEVEAAGGGRARLTPQAPSADLPGGGRMVLRLLLQDGQTVRGLVGPGGVVGLVEAGGRPLGNAYLTPRGMTRGRVGTTDLVLTDFVIQTAGIFDVHQDPGIWLVIIGGVILGLGTLWALAGYLGLLPAPVREE